MQNFKQEKGQNECLQRQRQRDDDFDLQIHVLVVRLVIALKHSIIGLRFRV